VTSGPGTPDVNLKAYPAERLAAPEERQAPRLFALILAACFLVHAAILALLFSGFLYLPRVHPGGRNSGGDRRRDAARAKDRTSREVSPPPPDLITPPVVKEKPPPEKVQLEDVQVAHDAPVSGNDSRTHKENPRRKRKRRASRRRPSSPRRRLPKTSRSRKRQRLHQKRNPPRHHRHRSRRNSPTTLPMPRLSTKPSRSRQPSNSQNKNATKQGSPPRAKTSRSRNSLPPLLRPLLFRGSFGQSRADQRWNRKGEL